MVKLKQLIEEGWIQCRIVLEIVGKPKEHVEKTIKEVVEKIKKEKGMKVLDAHIADIQKKETGAKEEGMIKEMWATFAEIEIIFKDLIRMTYFCFEYMPASIEILEPQKMALQAINLSEFFNDLQLRLHQVTMVAKQLNSKSIFLENNLQGLLTNFVLVALTNNEMTSEQLSKITGVEKERIEDFLDKLIDEGRVEMVGEKYRRLLDGGKKSS
ncbi:hypothetical protein KY306_01380 [Candidatus Woesearchaeota archaeon]|nr:hypothetical protein [Candidatus Woesearchaeota archaeon]